MGWQTCAPSLSHAGENALPCLGLCDQMCGSGLASDPLPLVVGRNSRVRNLTLTPTVAQGGGWVVDLQFQRETWWKLLPLDREFPHIWESKRDPSWSNIGEESRWPHGVRSLQLSLWRNTSQAVIKLKPGMIKKKRVMGMVSRSDSKEGLKDRALSAEGKFQESSWNAGFTHGSCSCEICLLHSWHWQVLDFCHFCWSADSAACTASIQRKCSTSSKACTPGSISSSLCDPQRDLI